MIGSEGISLATAGSLPPAAEPGAKVKAAAAARVENMAREMEATFLAMLLKEMRQTLEPDGGLFPGDSGDVHGGLFDMFMSRHLADGGGIGIAAALVRQMQATGAPETPPTTDERAPLALAAYGRTAPTPGE